MTVSRTSLRLGALLLGATLALSACSPSPAEDSMAASASPQADAITMTDAWVKTAESGMSAAFGELRNDGSEDVTVVSATTAASDMLELHETVENESGAMVMRKIEGGFVIPAGESLDLEPGGDHIMLMGLTAPVVAGDEVTFTLTLDDDSTFEFTAPAKDYAGANETYEEGDMDMESDQ